MKSKVQFCGVGALVFLMLISCSVPQKKETAQGGAAMNGDVCYIEPTEKLKATLSPEEYAVLVQAATEPPFKNAFWDNHAEGLYVDRIDGTPLFASTAKFDSGTGWPY